jgi:hypothetical protein
MPLLRRSAFFCECLVSSKLLENAPALILPWETLLERINSLIEIISRNDRKA